MLTKPVLEIILALQFATIVTLMMAMLAVLCVSIIKRDPETQRWGIEAPWRWLMAGGGFNPGLTVQLLTIGCANYGIYVICKMALHFVIGKDFIDNWSSIVLFACWSLFILSWRKTIEKSGGSLLSCRAARSIWITSSLVAAVIAFVIHPLAKQTIAFDPRISAYLSSQGHS